MAFSDKATTKISRRDRSNNIPVGSCKKFRLFNHAVGTIFEVRAGNKTHLVQITPHMVKMFLGSFVFTKRISKDIHRKQVQARHKRAFGKKK